jgi:hypothetical protein
MEVVKKLLVDEAVDQKPDLDALAAAYVYLQWIGTGGNLCRVWPRVSGSHTSSFFYILGGIATSFLTEFKSTG